MPIFWGFFTLKATILSTVFPFASSCTWVGTGFTKIFLHVADHRPDLNLDYIVPDLRRVSGIIHTLRARRLFEFFTSHLRESLSVRRTLKDVFPQAVSNTHTQHFKQYGCVLSLCWCTFCYFNKKYAWLTALFSETLEGGKDPLMPFSKYKVCVDKSSTKPRSTRYSIKRAFFQLITL